MDQRQPTESEDVLAAILDALPEGVDRQAPGTATYRLLDRVARRAVADAFSSEDPRPVSFGDYGRIVFPFRRMGAITSLELFGLDELVMFSFYLRQRQRYRRVLDIGANIGLHSLLLSRCGFEVRSFEPDPTTFRTLQATLEANHCSSVTVAEAAVSSSTGSMDFVRVVGNTTGSHLAGAKKKPYGELERFPVKTVGIGDILREIDFMKLDAEGHESVILCATDADHWLSTEAMVEIGSDENAESVFRHMSSLGVNLFAQMRGWNRVHSIADMPRSYRDGSLFITKREAMPW